MSDLNDTLKDSYIGKVATGGRKLISRNYFVMEDDRSHYSLNR